MDQLDGALRESKEDRMKQQIEEDIAEVKAVEENEKKAPENERQLCNQSVLQLTRGSDCRLQKKHGLLIQV